MNSKRAKHQPQPQTRQNLSQPSGIAFSLQSKPLYFSILNPLICFRSDCFLLFKFFSLILCVLCLVIFRFSLSFQLILPCNVTIRISAVSWERTAARLWKMKTSDTSV